MKPRRTVRVFKSFAEADVADQFSWLSRPMHERIAAVEALRVFAHGTPQDWKEFLS
jgi:hypothetical protein